ncbi:hypothetical protein ACFW81_28905 [Streptomyces angustmyceticus]|uniref:hypothetical protein n=1 Tax=Streptomyces angustmyceticus TaxID=285578 RepID=UPI0036853CD8
MNRRQLYWKGLRVPFIAPWSGEKALPVEIVRRHGIMGEQGIGYPDEDSRFDRRHGNLWVRMPAVRGVGRPNLGGVHSLRQRQAMSHMLCLVCGESTFGRDDERHLFLMRAPAGQPIAEGEVTPVPPVHESCAIESRRDCPHLRKGYTASLVEHAQPWGAAGILYDPKTLQPLPCKDGDEDGLTFVEFADPASRWLLAARDVVSLHGCTTVDLDELEQAATAVAA